VNGDVQMIPQEYDPAVPLAELTPHPANPNEGDLGQLCELLDANGFAGAVLAQKSTGLLIDGEHRLIAAREKGMATIPVLWLDVTDDVRDRLLTSINESTRKGRNNEARLLNLLTGLSSTPRGLEGTAFDGDDMDSLLARLNGPVPVPGAPTGSEYAETDGEQAERGDMRYNDRTAGGNLVEMILVYSTEQREEVGTLVDELRGALNDPKGRTPDVMLFAMRVAVAALSDDMAKVGSLIGSYNPVASDDDS